MTTDTTRTSTDRRAKVVAAFGGALQIVAFVTLAGVAYWTGSDVVGAGARLLLGGTVIWLLLFLVFAQRCRSAAEDLETEELRRAREAGVSAAIFEAGDESLLLERRRLNWLYTRILPTGTVALAVYHLVGAFAWWSWPWGLPMDDPGWGRTTHGGRAMPIIAGVGFLAFLYSRYVGGMARQSGWRMLRAASSFMAGNALACLVMLAALALSAYEVRWAEPVAAHLLRITLLLLGLEFLANFILDFYRPRVGRDEYRPSFDSRLLALISEPGGIARSLAEAINYQFGFEVSSTWFYQLLKRAVLPLTVFTILALIALSSIEMVDADEQAVIERFGTCLQERGETIPPGLKIKLPWPIDRVYKARVAQVHELVLGEAHVPDDEDQLHARAGHEHERPILWTDQHEFVPHALTLVASNQLDNLERRTVPVEGDAGRATAPGRSVAVSLLMMGVPIQYRIKNLHGYLYNYQDPEKVLEAVAYQALSDYAAGIDLERVMGPDRKKFNREFKQIVQRRVDELGLGLEIVFLCLQDVHPPAQKGVAAAFQRVVSAEHFRDARIEQARGLAETTLVKVAGSVRRARQLDEAVQQWDRLTADSASDAQVLAAAKARVDDLLMGNPARGLAPMSGDAAAALARGRGEAVRQVSEARSKAFTLQNELVAYQAAPRMFRVRKILEMWERSLTGIRKYVLTAPPDQMNLTVIMESEKKASIDLTSPELERDKLMKKQ